MNWCRLIRLSAWCVVASVAFAQQPSEMKPVADRLAVSIYNGPSMTTLGELSDGIGGRLTGSPAYVRSTEWAVEKFHSLGIQNVRLDPFTIDAGWQRGTASGAILTPLPRTLHLASLGWAPSTPAGGVEGAVVTVADVSPDVLRSREKELRGKIVLLESSKITAEGYGKALPKLEAAWAAFQKAGVLAVIVPDRTPNNVINAHAALWGSKLVPLPAAQVGMEDAKLIQRDLERGPVTVHLTIENTTSGPMTVNNVVAEIRGSERPDEWILIGAHLDSWDFGTGAEDNGTGAVSVIEVARAMMALGKPPRRSVRFALWGGEEQGLLGSYAYTQSHLSDMKKCVAVLNTDNGAGHPKGWKTEGREDLKTAMQPWSDALLKEMSGGGLSTETTYDTDHGPFMLQGIPVLDLEVDMSHYFELHHKSSDTFDKVDPLDFKGGEAIVAVTAYAIAQSDAAIAPHIDHDTVDEILRKAKLEDLLVNIGIWQP
ncbi:MAG TPA: M20/M25/M40 family metallo-hydrolase [Terriglobales bacterium]|nr:M20/M25/M40 family metallo-hydrolase [Terriglobales bacterium]